MPEKILVALGGHSLIRPGQRGTIAEQSENLRTSLAGVAELIRRGHPIVITHGNGPHVGNILLRSEAARDRAYELPLDVCVAQSQGEIGYLIQQALAALVRERPSAAILTRTVIDTNDPQLRKPTKPIGSAGRLVPSPVPVRILEAGVIRRLFEDGVVVIAAGGGGIPVREKRGELHGVEGVVDKDLASCALALAIGAEKIFDLTSVESVMLNFGTPRQTAIRSMTAAEARRYLHEGHFPAGSMGPKIEGAIQFLERGGREVVITLPERMLDEASGTRLFAGAKP